MIIRVILLSTHTVNILLPVTTEHLCMYFFCYYRPASSNFQLTTFMFLKYDKALYLNSGRTSTSQKKIKVHVDDAQDLQEILAKLDELLESMRYNFQVRHPDDAMDDQYGQPIPKRKLLSIDDKSDEENMIDEGSSQEDELTMEDPDQMINLNAKDTKSLSGGIQDPNSESCINSHNDAKSESSCSSIADEDKENLETNINDDLTANVKPIDQEMENTSQEESKEQQNMINNEATDNVKDVEENKVFDEEVTEDEDVSSEHSNPDLIATIDSSSDKSNNEAKTHTENNETGEKEIEDANDNEEDIEEFLDIGSKTQVNMSLQIFKENCLIFDF